MINMRKIFKNKETKAALLAGMTLLTLPGCGKKNVETDSEPGASISIEEDTTKKKNNIETTVENMIEGKTTGENNGTGTGETYTDNGTEYVEYTDPTEEYTEGQTEVKTEGKTEAKTEAKTEGKTETGIKLPSDHRVGNVDTTEHTTQKPTHKTTTIKNKDIKVTTTTAKKTTTAKPTTTKKVTTTTKVVTTQKPTTQKPTEPPTTQPPAPTYDYTLENITQSAEVFNYFAEQMNNDLFEGASVVTKRFYENEESYDGKMQAKVALLILNENANFKDSVLKTVFAGYDDALIREGVEYFFFAPMVEKVCGSEIDYSIYSIDKNIGNYINQLKEARKNGDTTGDYTNMDKILEDILYNGKYDYVSSNIAATYYSIGIGAFCTNSKYHGDCLSFSDDGSFCGIQGETEDRVKELTRW